MSVIAWRAIRTDALLERLAQRVERARRELAELVEEQHAAVRERDLAGAGSAAAAADERGDRCRVVRGAERRARATSARVASPGDRVDARDLERLVVARAAGGSWRAGGRASSCRRPAAR